MSEIEQISIEKLGKLYQKYFSLGYFNADINTKFALISMICYLTFQLREKHKNISCYDLIIKIAEDKYTKREKIGVYKSLAVICEDFMYSCSEFPTFGLKAKDMPNEIRKILNTYCPF